MSKQVDKFIEQFCVDGDIEFDGAFGSKTSLRHLLNEYEKKLVNKDQQRELLIAFYKEIEGDYLYPEERDRNVDDFLNSKQ